MDKEDRILSSLDNVNIAIDKMRSDFDNKLDKFNETMDRKLSELFEKNNADRIAIAEHGFKICNLETDISGIGKKLTDHIDNENEQQKNEIKNHTKLEMKVVIIWGVILFIGTGIGSAMAMVIINKLFN